MSQVGTQKRSDQELAEQLGISRNQVQRFVRLSYLCDELLDWADTKKLPLITGVALSFLTPEHQKFMYQVMCDNGVPKMDIVNQIKELEQSGTLTEEMILQIVTGETDSKSKSGGKKVISIPVAEISSLLPPETKDAKKAVRHKLQWQFDLFTKYFSGIPETDAEAKIAEILNEWFKQ